MRKTAANPRGGLTPAQGTDGRRHSSRDDDGRLHANLAPGARERAQPARNGCRHRGRAAASGQRPLGFTLLEVLVALAVVAIALLAAMRAAGSVGDNATRYRHAVLAEQCAQNLLIEQRLRKVFPPVGTSTGSCTQAGVTFTLEQNVLPTPNPNFRRVQVTVLDPAGWSAWQVVTIAGNMP